MARAFIGVGSNLQPERNVLEALRLLAGRVRVVAISTLYATEPLNRPEQPTFYNGVVEVETDISARELKLEVLRGIEAELGRVRGPDKWAARTIDLDVLVYDELIVHNDHLTLPDPDIAHREFIALPLFELAPDLVVPGMDRAMREVVGDFAGHNMTALPEYTRQLRGELIDGQRQGP